MTRRPLHPGPLSDLAARYLEGADAWSDPILEAEADRRRSENDVIIAMIAIKRARGQRRPFTDLEQQLIARAHDQVRRGVQPPALFRGIGRSGGRSHQTLISLADEGAGHLGVTLRNPDLLDGVVVHHEVIVRTGRDGRYDSLIAPYRMINIRDNGVIRLHAADDVPVTVYCGRPNYVMTGWQGQPGDLSSVAHAYDRDPVTPCHIAAATASAAFANGVADVKFNFDGLTVMQATDFMRRMKMAVDKRDDQYLSTQFNLNQSIVDDRPANNGAPEAHRLVSDRAAIARLAVEMTRDGGWDRVTIDSAGSAERSEPLVTLLGFEGLVNWVNEAHAAGLDTYISGGMCDEHIELATHAGVGGVGIGSWLHCSDPDTGSMGLDAGRISRVIRERNKAEASTQGLAARLLARLHLLDSMEKHPHARALRDVLLPAMVARDEQQLVPLVQRGRAIGFL